jgi:hypothetical protein
MMSPFDLIVCSLIDKISSSPTRGQKYSKKQKLKVTHQRVVPLTVGISGTRMSGKVRLLAVFGYFYSARSPPKELGDTLYSAGGIYRSDFGHVRFEARCESHKR